MAFEAVTTTLPGGITPVFQPVYAASLYGPDGKRIETYTHTVSQSHRVEFLGVDRTGRVYIGAVASGGLAILVRASDRPFVPEWVSEISNTRLDLRAIAFDPQDNPVALGIDRNHTVPVCGS